MNEYFQSIVSSLDGKIAEPGGAAPRRIYTRELSRLGMRLYGGEHRVAWDGRSDAGTAQASGSYVVQLRTDERIDSKRVMLVK